MRGIPPADISAVFREGKSGPFPNPYLTEGQLLELSALCLQTNRVIRNVEAFGITDEADTARIEFSIYSDRPGGSADTWRERARRSHEEIVKLVADVRAQPDRIMFEVWLDWE
jgi:hypothetical protein